MLKVLIVDDKKDERQGIIDTVNWSSVGMEIAGQASNGIEGVEAAKTILPDIIISDIIMPQMDGIKMAEQIRVFLPNVRIIFISCYEEMKFARAAIKLSASGYVLKPVIVSELLDALNNAVMSIHPEHKTVELSSGYIEMIKENALRRLFVRHDTKDFKENFKLFGITDEQILYQVFVVAIESVCDEKISERIILELGKLSRLLNKNILGPAYCSSTQIAGIFIGGISHKEIDGLFTTLIQNIETDITAAIGIEVNTIEQITESYGTALKALEYKFFKGKNKIIFWDESEQETPLLSEKNLDIDFVNSNLKSTILSKDSTQIDLFLDRIFLPRKNASKEYFKVISGTIINMIYFLAKDMNLQFEEFLPDSINVYDKLNEFDTADEIKTFIKEILTAFNSNINSLNNTRNIRIVEEIKAFLEKNYNVHLKQEEISAVVFLSPLYANCIFKNITGYSFLDYQVKLRIEKAKELLKDPKYKIYEISEAIGYWNKPYFSILFKKYTGMTPKEYRNKF